MSTLTAVLRQVAAEGHLDLEAVSRLASAGHSGERDAAPWFVRVLIGFGAWVSAVFLVLFLFAADLVSESGAAVVPGIVFLVAAFLLRRRAGGSDFLQQLALAVWLVGQVLTILGVGDGYDSVAAAALVSLVVQGATIRWFPDAVARFLATCFAAVSVGALLDDVDMPFALDVTVLAVAVPAGFLWWRRPAALAGPLAEAVHPVAYGLVTSAFLLLLTTFGDPFEHGGGVGLVAGAGLTGAVAVMAWILLGRQVTTPPGLGVIGGLLILGAAMMTSAPGVMAGVGALLLGFRARDRVLLGMAWLFLAVFLTGFYYDLEITLLEKSGLLAASGAVLLALREIVRRWVS